MFFHKIFMICIFVFKLNIELRSFLMRCLKLKSTSPLASQMIAFCKKTEDITTYGISETFEYHLFIQFITLVQVSHTYVGPKIFQIAL